MKVTSFRRKQEEPYDPERIARAKLDAEEHKSPVVRVAAITMLDPKAESVFLHERLEKESDPEVRTAIERKLSSAG